MRHNELRKFLKAANGARLSPIEKDVFQYYYSRAQKTGEWFCPDAETAEEIGRSRSGVAEARISLIYTHKWIKENGKYNIQILKNFSEPDAKSEENSVAFPTKPAENPVGNATDDQESCRISDNLVGNATKTPENLVGNATALKEKRNFKEDIKGNKEVKEEEGARACAAAAPPPEPSEIFLPEELSPLEAYSIVFPDYKPTGFQKQMIHNRIRDGTVWRQTLFFWAGNDHKPQSIEKMCDKYDKLVREKEELPQENAIDKGFREGKTSKQKRDEYAISANRLREQNRRNVEERRAELLRSNNADDR